MSAYTLHDHSRDWALRQGAPEEVADAYADHVFSEDANGAYGEMGASHPSEWRRWCEQNISDCPECGGRWMMAASRGWECHTCIFEWTGAV